MTEIYRWAVVSPHGTVFLLGESPENAIDLFLMPADFKPWYAYEVNGYTVKKFRLVECEEGEGE